jgi:hypothetical protein
MTQNNLGNALQRLGEREDGTARLEEAVAAFEVCLMVVVSAWPDEWVQGVREHATMHRQTLRAKEWARFMNLSG